MVAKAMGISLGHSLGGCDGDGGSGCRGCSAFGNCWGGGGRGSSSGSDWPYPNCCCCGGGGGCGGCCCWSRCRGVCSSLLPHRCGCGFCGGCGGCGCCGLPPHGRSLSAFHVIDFGDSVLHTGLASSDAMVSGSPPSGGACTAIGDQSSEDSSCSDDENAPKRGFATAAAGYSTRAAWIAARGGTTASGASCSKLTHPFQKGSDASPRAQTSARISSLSGMRRKVSHLQNSISSALSSPTEIPPHCAMNELAWKTSSDDLEARTSAVTSSRCTL
mmetsp:Transcript_28148/g.85121  ORF Transcript_28148/g.85121 Transcript_28148/m.85121 type:complete len:274 (-) Transcript_28148:311-1132(-)